MAEKDYIDQSSHNIFDGNSLEIHCLYTGQADFSIIEEKYTKEEENKEVSFMIIDAGINNPKITTEKIMEKTTHAYFRQLNEFEAYEPLLEDPEILENINEDYEKKYEVYNKKIPLKSVGLSHFHVDHMSLIWKYIITYHPKTVFLPKNYHKFLENKKEITKVKNQNKKNSCQNFDDSRWQLKYLLTNHCKNFTEKDGIIIPPPEKTKNKNIIPQNKNPKYYKFDAIIPSKSYFELPKILPSTTIEFPYFNREELDDRNQNAQSLVFRLVYHTKTNSKENIGSALFTGDLPLEEWERLWLKWRDNLPSKLLKVSHHGSKYANSHSIIEDVKPEFAIITSNKTIEQVLNSDTNKTNTNSSEEKGSDEQKEKSNSKSGLPDRIVVEAFLKLMNNDVSNEMVKPPKYLNITEDINNNDFGWSPQTSFNRALFSTAEYTQKTENGKIIESIKTAPLSHIFIIDQTTGNMKVSITNLIINEEHIPNQ